MIVLFLQHIISTKSDASDPIYTVWGEELNKEHPLPEYPRPQFARGDNSWLNLNGRWNFKYHGYNGNIIVPFSPQSILSGLPIKYRADNNNTLLTYSREFDIPDSVLYNIKRDKVRVLLHLGASDSYTKVYINDEYVDSNSNGFLPFTCEITAYLSTSENTNSIKIVVKDSDYYNYVYGKQNSNSGNLWHTNQAGIWQTVWLEFVPNVYIDQLKLTPFFENQTIKVTPSIMLQKNEYNNYVEVVYRNKETDLSVSKVLYYYNEITDFNVAKELERLYSQVEIILYDFQDHPFRKFEIWPDKLQDFNLTAQLTTPYARQVPMTFYDNRGRKVEKVIVESEDIPNYEIPDKYYTDGSIRFTLFDKKFERSVEREVKLVDLPQFNIGEELFSKYRLTIHLQFKNNSNKKIPLGNFVEFDYDSVLAEVNAEIGDVSNLLLYINSTSKKEQYPEDKHVVTKPVTKEELKSWINNYFTLSFRSITASYFDTRREYFNQTLFSYSQLSNSNTYKTIIQEHYCGFVEVTFDIPSNPAYTDIREYYTVPQNYFHLNLLSRNLSKIYELYKNPYSGKMQISFYDPKHLVFKQKVMTISEYSTYNYAAHARENNDGDYHIYCYQRFIDKQNHKYSWKLLTFQVQFNELKSFSFANVLPEESELLKPLESPLTVQIYDQSDVLIGTVSLKTKESAYVQIPDELFYPWTPEDPYLYKVKVTYEYKDEAKGIDIKDAVSSYFGMRSFKVARDKKGVPRIFLNGKPYFQVGVLDQGYWSDGLFTPPSDEAMVYDIKLAKSLGFNMIRKNEKIEPLRWYYHCDRLGMIVWQDIISSGDVRFNAFNKALAKSGVKVSDTSLFSSIIDGRGFFNDDDEYKYEKLSGWEGQVMAYTALLHTIDLLYNTVSIGTWVLFNEGRGQFDSLTIVERLRQLDNTRIIDHASGGYDQGGGDLSSLHIYNKEIKVPHIDKKYRAVVLSEFGGYGYYIYGNVQTNKQFSYKMFSTKAELQNAYESLINDQVKPACETLGATVYTQLTDVENEVNGFITMDRKIVKMNITRVYEINQNITLPE